LITSTLTNCTFAVNNLEEMKRKVLSWTKQFNTFCFLDNHQYRFEPHAMECLLGAGVRRQLVAEPGNALDQLQQFIREGTGWLFGHLGYDLKNEIENLNSLHPDQIRFPALHFFEPEIVIRFNEKEMIVEAGNPAGIFSEIMAAEIPVSGQRDRINVRNRVTRKEYLEIIERLREHILRGDCYEINFCQEFYAEQAVIDPVAVYHQLSRISPSPFSALYKMGDRWLICSSPERFLKKEGKKIISQPMKGTSRRDIADAEKDKKSKDELHYSEKDRSENVMVVDLVRNDLAKVCREGTVKVDELYGVYSFPQVHQMVSTVSGELKENISFPEIIHAAFPMGSMTGAPKKRVMELIEAVEKTKRGIFSGALGYISPGGDFDLNVVIRSILYNAGTKYLSFQAGSGITFYSDPGKEWEECMMKAEAMKRALRE
jgi:para-aminobenzoate synthetase component 1